MVKIYIEKENAPDVPMSPVFWPNFRFPISPKRLFLAEIMAQYHEPFFQIVEQPADADFFAVPYEYFFVLDQGSVYLSSVYEKARQAGKKVLLFDYTDYCDRAVSPPSHAILFRVSVYRHHKKENEVVMPYFVEDMGARHNITPKEKGERCVVGYCGQSRFASIARALRARLKWLVYFFWLHLVGDPNPLVHMRGIFWRARALQILRNAGIPLLVKERAFYSLHRASLTEDPAVVRKEYIENLREADLALCVRGDANASQRFYEALSAARLPLFLDTDCVLPLEEVIDYDRVMLRVHSHEIATLPARVRAWQGGKGLAARNLYTEYLRLDRFFATVFDREKSPYKRILFSL